MKVLQVIIFIVIQVSFKIFFFVLLLADLYEIAKGGGGQRMSVVLVVVALAVVVERGGVNGLGDVVGENAMRLIDTIFYLFRRFLLIFIFGPRVHLIQQAIVVFRSNVAGLTTKAHVLALLMFHNDYTIKLIIKLYHTKINPKRKYIIQLSPNGIYAKVGFKFRLYFQNINFIVEYFIIMENNSQRSVGRPLLFNNKTDLHNFVHNNNSQAVSISMPNNPPRIVSQQMPFNSLFDRYNRPNLLLRDCDSKDIRELNKNIVMHEQALSGQFIEQIGQIIRQTPQKKVQATSQGFYRQKVQGNWMQEKPSRQFIQNEIFFNYKQMGSIKKKKKEEFLSQIENRIAEAEKQIVQLQHLQDQQKMEMQEFTHFHAKVGEELTKNVQTGQMRGKIGKAIGYQTQQLKQVFHIHPQMRSNQINEILQDHFKLNEDILQLANNLRVKSKQKPKDKPEFTKTTFGNTIIHGKNDSKSLVSTMKTNKLGKNKKGR